MKLDEFWNIFTTVPAIKNKNQKLPEFDRNQRAIYKKKKIKIKTPTGPNFLQLTPYQGGNSRCYASIFACLCLVLEYRRHLAGKLFHQCSGYTVISIVTERIFELTVSKRPVCIIRL